jgi:hypothetical protein
MMAAQCAAAPHGGRDGEEAQTEDEIKPKCERFLALPARTADVEPETKAAAPRAEASSVQLAKKALHYRMACS